MPSSQKNIVHCSVTELNTSNDILGKAQRVFDDLKGPIGQIVSVYTIGQRDGAWFSGTVTRFLVSLSLVTHLTHISGYSWMVPIADVETLSEQYLVFNFKYDDFLNVTIEPELVERAEKREKKKKPAPTLMADALGLSLPIRSPKLANTPDESIESEEEVALAGKRAKGKGKQLQHSTSAEPSPVVPTPSSSRKVKQEFKSNPYVDTADDASDVEEVQKPSLRKTPAPKLDTRKATAIVSRPRPAPPKDPLRLQYGTDSPLSLAEIQLLQTNMNRELLHVACVHCVVTRHDQDCEPSDPGSIPEGIAQSKCIRCNKQNQHCSFSEETDVANDKLLKLLAAIFSHPKVVRLLGVEAVGLGKVYLHALQAAVQSQQTARLAQEAFSTKLSQFVGSGHNPKSVLDALNNGQSEFSPTNEEILTKFTGPLFPPVLLLPIKPLHDDEEDAEGSVDEELKAQTAIKTMKAQVAKAKDSQGQETRTTEASTSGSRTRAGRWLGNPVPTPRSNPP
ncbi:hypothetical protein L218DRAFT_1010011 [Marasmius fiardii PR-910]|nr:hypothetical protein L218DRAFT_1010011 [Marasmius fiardii PR-910]